MTIRDEEPKLEPTREDASPSYRLPYERWGASIQSGWVSIEVNPTDRSVGRDWPPVCVLCLSSSVRLWRLNTIYGRAIDFRVPLCDGCREKWERYQTLLTCMCVVAFATALAFPWLALAMLAVHPATLVVIDLGIFVVMFLSLFPFLRRHAYPIKIGPIRPWTLNIVRVGFRNPAYLHLLKSG